MQNYFNYFTEIEEHFQRRRGSLLLLSTIDWALIETWREAGIPLAAVLQGIDAAFDKFDARKNKSRVRRVNGLAYCAQEVISAMEAMQEAAVGAAPATARHRGAGLRTGTDRSPPGSCRAAAPRSAFVGRDRRSTPGAGPRNKKQGCPTSRSWSSPSRCLEEKLFAIILTTTPEAELLALRQQAAAELAPYRSRMPAMQIRQVEQQFLHKRLLEKFSLPRLSLFYMSQG